LRSGVSRECKYKVSRIFLSDVWGATTVVGDFVNLALSGEVKQGNEFNALRNCSGKRRLIVFQGDSEWLPKPEGGETPIHLRRTKY
jgi:hypothetical protein